MPESTTPLHVYLNDHLAGAAAGVELAEHLASRHAGTELGQFLEQLTRDIKDDKQALEDIMKRADIQPSPLKQAGGKIMEKLSEVKLAVSARGQEEAATLLGLETLSLGVEGKASLWKALQRAADRQVTLGPVDYDGLLKRASDQRSGLEERRLSAAEVALGGSAHI